MRGELHLFLDAMNAGKIPSRCHDWSIVLAFCAHFVKWEAPALNSACWFVRFVCVKDALRLNFVIRIYERRPTKLPGTVQTHSRLRRSCDDIPAPSARGNASMRAVSPRSEMRLLSLWLREPQPTFVMNPCFKAAQRSSQWKPRRSRCHVSTLHLMGFKY
jgi:hypothetical protein